jgi:hypothetical protein
MLLHDIGIKGEWNLKELEHGYEALSDGIIKYFPSHIVFHVMFVRISIQLEGKILFGFCL